MKNSSLKLKEGLSKSFDSPYWSYDKKKIISDDDKRADKTNRRIIKTNNSWTNYSLSDLWSTRDANNGLAKMTWLLEKDSRGSKSSIAWWYSA